MESNSAYILHAISDNERDYDTTYDGHVWQELDSFIHLEVYIGNLYGVIMLRRFCDCCDAENRRCFFFKMQGGLFLKHLKPTPTYVHHDLGFTSRAVRMYLPSSHGTSQVGLFVKEERAKNLDRLIYNSITSTLDYMTHGSEQRQSTVYAILQDMHERLRKKYALRWLKRTSDIMKIRALTSAQRMIVLFHLNDCIKEPILREYICKLAGIW